jgi:hypothetical protein
MPDNLIWRPFASASGRDPVQQLFLDKIAEYRKRSASSPDGLVDAGDDTRKALAEENMRVRRNYNVPEGQEAVITAKFTDEQFQLEPINQKDWK